MSVTSLAVYLLLFYTLFRTVQWLWRLLVTYNQLRNVPGGVHYHITHPQFMFAPVMRHYPQWSVGDFRAKGLPYEKAGVSVIPSIPLSEPRPYIWVSDPQTLTAIGSNRTLFPKQTELYDAIAFYGPNLVSTEGADWKRHRDASKAAFGEGNNMLVWRESMKAVGEWFSEVDSEKTGKDTLVLDIPEVTTRLALLIIGSAGFGLQLTASEADHDHDSNVPPKSKSGPSERMAFIPSLLSAVKNMSMMMLVSSYPILSHLPFDVVRIAQQSYGDLKVHLKAMIEAERKKTREGGTQSGEADLFRRLIRANEEDGALSDDELLSTTYVFLLAGHETTANALAFACALLALNPDIQRKLQKEADEVWPDGLPSVEDAIQSYREDMPRLKYAEATFREALRLFPAETRLTKVAAQDTVLHGRYLATGEKYEIPVPKDTILWLDTWAVHTMTEWWGEDASEFNPDRFFDRDDYKWPRDAYMPFSLGARSCIGARFATLEGIVILSHIAHTYDLVLPADVEAIQDIEERKNIMLKWGIGVATTSLGARVGLRKRSKV